MSTETTEKKYLNFWQKLAYGSGDLAANCCYGLVSSFVLLYLTSTLGLNSGIIATLMLISKILDGISDVLFGSLIDNTHSKMGKARPWMFYAQIGVSVCLFFLFSTPKMSQGAQYAYFFIIYTALNVVFYTANNIAYSALTALITKNDSERVQLGSFRFVFAVLANIAMSFIVTAMVEGFGGGNAGWRTTALIFAILGFVVNSISCLSVKELPESELDTLANGVVAKKEKVTFKQTVSLLLQNKYYLIVFVIYILYYIISNLATGAGVFFAKYYWGDEGLLGVMNLMLMFPVIIALVLSPMLVRKVGSMQKVNLTGYILSLIMNIPLIFFALKKMFVPYLICMFFKGLFAGALQGSLNALIAEISEYTTRTSGVRMDGMMYSCSSAGIKIGSGLGTALTGWMLALGKFDGALAVQPQSAINMTFHLSITIPLTISICITILLSFLTVEKANKKWDEEHKNEAAKSEN